jgi:hypothetical protein
MRISIFTILLIVPLFCFSQLEITKDNFQPIADTSYWYAWENPRVVLNPQGGENMYWDYTNEGRYKTYKPFIRQAQLESDCFNSEFGHKYAVGEIPSRFFRIRTQRFQRVGDFGILIEGITVDSAIVKKGNYVLEILSNCDSVDNVFLQKLPVKYGSVWDYSWVTNIPFVLNYPDRGLENKSGKIVLSRIGTAKSIGWGTLVLPYQDSLTVEFNSQLVSREAKVTVSIYFENELAPDSILKDLRMEQGLTKYENWKYFINPENEFLATFSLNKDNNMAHADFLQEKSMVFRLEENIDSKNE